jgi:hypothetical protein
MATGPMSNHPQHQLVHFLEKDLAVPPESIDLALRRTEHAPNLLPIILWQYGLVTMNQLEQIFDWLENSKFSI